MVDKQCCIVCCTISEGVETRTIRNVDDLENLNLKEKKFKVKKPVTFKDQMIQNKLQVNAALKKLVICTCFSLVFIAAEIYGGLLSGSIAVFTDAAHLGADIIGFAISMIALKLSQVGKSDSLSYGWHRAEVIGTLISVATMWIMTVWLVVEATYRFFEPPKVEGLTMLVVACIGFVFNLI